jgi:hypothetical protein
MKMKRRLTIISLEHGSKIIFEPDLLDIMQKKFWATVKQFELTELPDIETFNRAMRGFNSSKTKSTEKMDIQKMTLIYMLIERGFKLNTLREKLNLSKSTYYRYVNFFKVCGISQTSSQSFYKPYFDFSTYYLEINQEQYRRLYAGAWSI